MALIVRAYLDILRDEEDLLGSGSVLPASIIRILLWKILGTGSVVLTYTFYCLS